MTCRFTLSLIEPYIDGELDAGQMAEVRRHLEECEECAAAHRRLRDLSDNLRTMAPRYAAPEELRARVIRMVRPQSVRRPVESKASVMPRRRIVTEWAIAATVLLAVSVGTNFVVRNSETSNAVTQEIVSSHMRSLIGEHLLDVPSTDQHNVKPWFNGKLDYAPDVKDFAAAGFALIGGRVDYLDRRRVAALVYKRHQHVINLFVWPSGSKLTPPDSVSGFNLVAWNSAGMEYCAVSDLNLQELGQFAALYRQ